MRRKVMRLFSLLTLTILLSIIACRAQVEAGNSDSPSPPVVAKAKGDKVLNSNGVLSAFEAELTKVVDKVAPSVVTIFAVQEVQFNPFDDFDFPFRLPFEPFRQEKRSLGSGVIVKLSKGKVYILTNNHVVEDAKKITVRFDRHTEREARIVGTDPKTDIAVLEVNAKGLKGLEKKIAVLGDSDKVRVGQLVIAIGNPYGLERTVTVGVVSALKRSIGITQYESYIQTDAAINPGNSGGPLINIHGEVVGINTAIVASGQGLGFAIPINLARWVMDQILEHGRVIRGWLGVVIQEVTPDIAEAIGVREGIIIAQVMKGSPADKYGLKVGDVIVEVDGKKIDSVRDLQLRIMRTKPGTEVTLKVIREGKKKSIKVKVGELPEKTSGKRKSYEGKGLGLTLKNMTAQERSRFGVEGVVVVGVVPGSPAHHSGLRPGDIIMRVNHKKVKRVDEFYRIIESLKEMGKAKALLLVRRGEGNVYVVLALE